MASTFTDISNVSYTIDINGKLTEASYTSGGLTKSNVKTATLGTNITRIDNYAFRDATSLTSITSTNISDTTGNSNRSQTCRILEHSSTNSSDCIRNSNRSQCCFFKPTLSNTSE